MTDRVLFQLTDKWALGYDSMQWIVMRWQSPRWRAKSFIGSTKAVLMRDLREKGIEPTPEAQVALDALPASFREWISQRDMQEAAE